MVDFNDVLETKLTAKYYDLKAKLPRSDPQIYSERVIDLDNNDGYFSEE